MLTAYLDETGQEQDEEQMFVAGFYGNDDAWRKLAVEWPKSLGNQRKHLHMNTLKFKRESERRMLERAGAIPEMCGLIPILGGVRRKDYRDLLKGLPDEHAINGYVLCIWAMMFDTLRCLPEGERIEFVFEDQQRLEPSARAAISNMLSEYREETHLPNGLPKLANYSWVPKHSTMMLEPADYFCYSLLQSRKAPGSRRDQWCRPIMATNGGNGFGAIFTRDQVREATKGGLVGRFNLIMEKMEKRK